MREELPTIASGCLLVASTQLRSGCFYRSVVLVIEHLREGTWGVMLNYPTALAVSELCPSFGPVIADPGLVHYGGPVGEDSAVGIGVLAQHTELPPGVHVLSGDIAILDLTAEVAAVQPALSQVRVFGGYAGWDHGQLAAEVAEGAWHVLPALTSDITTEPARLWASVLRRQPPPLSWYASYPDDPAEN